MIYPAGGDLLPAARRLARAILLGAVERAPRGARAQTTAPDLPLHDPAAGYEERIRPAIEALEEADGPVVVVAHSQSSALGPLVAAPGRSRSSSTYARGWGARAARGAPGAFREGVPWPADRPDGTTAWDPEVAIEAIYSRLGPEGRPRWRSACGRWRCRPTTTRSESIPTSRRRWSTRPRTSSSSRPSSGSWPAGCWGSSRSSFRGGHFPMIEDPDGLAGLMDRLTRERR